MIVLNGILWWALQAQGYVWAAPFMREFMDASKGMREMF
jgi:hypothetical protein